MPKEKTLEALFYDTLKDIYYAERKILKTLPKMKRAAQSEALKAAFEKHREETEGHVERLVQVFEIIREIVAHAAAEVRESTIEVNSATGRPFLIEFAPDPDIIIREEMEHQHYRNVVAIEVKSGTDVSNIHNRIGEAEKSHQKARQRGFTECWTVVNVGRLDMAKARSESPSTDRFYSLAALSLRAGDEYDDFRRRVLSLTAIPAAPTNP